MTPTTDTKKLLSLAKDCVKQAGRLLRKGGKKLHRVHQRFAHDVKLEADRAAERLIRKKLEKTGIPIIGEEYGGNEKLLHSDEFYWAVDPLDGTVNYAAGIPFSCSCVGLWRGATPILGAVYDFWRNELFLGVVGQGATLNGKALYVPTHITKKAEALAVILSNDPDASFERLQKERWSYKHTRNLGSCALTVSVMAAGRIGAFREDLVKIWDVAAALAIVKAAGGVVHVEPVAGFKLNACAAWNEALLPNT